MARLRSPRRLLLRLGQIEPRQRVLLAEAVLCLLAARLALIFIPFPRLARRLGRIVPPAEARSCVGLPRRDHARLAGDIGWAVTRAARYVPFEAGCLPQARRA